MDSQCRWCFLAFAVLTGALLRGQSAGGDDLANAMRLAGQGQFGEAERMLRAIETTHPNGFEVRYRLGLILLRQGNAKDAAARFEAAAQRAPNSALAWLGLAQARLRLDLRQTALQAAERATKLALAEPPLWRALALFYADAGEYARAADLEDRWSQTRGADLESPVRLCRLRVRAADNKRAVPACLRAIAGRDTAELRQWLGDAYRIAADAPRAAAEYQHAIRLEPAAPESYLKLVALLLDHRTPVPAIAVLDSAVARFKNQPEFQRLLGLAHYQTGDFEKAIQHFLAAIDLDPDADAGYASIETLIPVAGARLDEIGERLRAFRQRHPESPVGHFLLSRALGASPTPPGREVEALLRQAIQADPNFWPAHFELGLMEELANKPESAIGSLERAAKLNPGYAPVHYSLAQLYARTGDRPRAIEHRKKHHALLDRERARTERARAESPALLFTLEPPPER